MVLEVSDPFNYSVALSLWPRAVMAEVCVRANTHLKARKNKSESKEEPGSWNLF